MYYSKKKRAEMRKRRNKQKHTTEEDHEHEHDQQSSAPPPASTSTTATASGAKRKRDQRDEGSTSAPSQEQVAFTTVQIPEGLGGKEARKFRKDARRKARADGRDESSIRFVDANGKEIDANNNDNEQGGDGNNNNNEEESAPASQQPPPEKKRSKKPKRSFPRINDMLKAHEEEQKRQKEIDSRPPVPEDEQQKYVALDCEMVGIGAGGKQSALARVSMTDWNHTVLLDTFVQVPDRVTDFRTHVSGVRAADIKAKNDDAMELHACRLKVGQMLQKKILVGHALKNDLSALMLYHPRDDIRDTAKYRPFMRPSGRGGGKMRPRKLRDLVKQHLDLDIQVAGEAHCSIDDAQATMKLYRFAKDEWDRDEASKKMGGKIRRMK